MNEVTTYVHVYQIPVPSFQIHAMHDDYEEKRTFSLDLEVSLNRHRTATTTKVRYEYEY